MVLECKKEQQLFSVTRCTLGGSEARWFIEGSWWHKKHNKELNC